MNYQRISKMLPFNELPPSLVKELGLYVKQNTPKILEYDFIDISKKNESYNSHLIWHDYTAWYVAHEIHIFQIPNKFDWCYYSGDQIFSVEEARTKLKYLKSRYIKEIKAYKEYQQNKRLSKLYEDFND